MSEIPFPSLPELAGVAASAVVIYLAVVVATRIAGKRSFSKMSSFDFAVTVAIGSVVATTVVSGGVGLGRGLMGLGMLYLLQMSVAALRRYGWMRRLVDNQPLLLVDGEEILEGNLRRARVTLSDLRGKLREANVVHRSQVIAVVFESTGDVSVLHEAGGSELDPWLLEEVER